MNEEEMISDVIDYIDHLFVPSDKKEIDAHNKRMDVVKKEITLLVSAIKHG